MRIVLYAINFAPELVGIGKYTGDMAEWLAIRGHEVRVVTAPPYYPEWQVHAGYGSRWYSRECWRGVIVWRCPVYIPDQPKSIKRLLYLFSFATSSFPIILRQLFWRPAVVWVVEPPLFCAPAAWIVARLCRAKAWLHVQDYEVEAAFELGLIRGSTIRRLVTAWESWLMRRFDRVSTISERMLEHARSKGVLKERLVSFPNWVNLDSVEASDRLPSLREELSIGSDTVVALYSGTMGRKQGLELLGDAAARLADDPQLSFVFCGEGPGREELMARCALLPNVRFLGLQPIERLGPLLSMADIHLLPQQADVADLVMPSKLTGILASGRPVVATCDTNTELAKVVTDRGLIVPPGDVDAFVEAIRSLTSDSSRRAWLGANGRAYAEQNLRSEAVLATFEDRLRALTGFTDPC